MFIRIASCSLNSSRELVSTMCDGKEFQSFVAVGKKENRWQSILEKGINSLYEWPLVTLKPGIKSGAAVILCKT